MAPPNPRSNRGPAAAPDNRRALVEVARRLFAERGYRVPLNAIAREAGVGQGVLYRHFPNRIDLALAAFEYNFAELETIAAEPGDDAFGRLWSRLLELTVEASAFIEMVVDARRTLPRHDLAERLSRLVDATLPRAVAAGLVDGRLTVDDVLLALRMAYGVVVTETEPGRARATVEHALALPWSPLVAPGAVRRRG